MNRAYQPVLLNTLRSNFWSFAIQRAVLAASTTTPAFGPSHYYPLPGDFVMLAPPDQINTSQALGALSPTPSTTYQSQYTDWQIEQMPNQGGVAIVSSNPSPLYIRYISSSVPEANFDPSFAEAFSANLALETCEELTQSNTKIQTIAQFLKDTIENAKKRNAFENKPVQPPVDTWILSRM